MPLCKYCEHGNPVSSVCNKLITVKGGDYDKYTVRVEGCERGFQASPKSCSSCLGCPKPGPNLDVEQWAKTCLEHDYLNWRPKWWKE